MKERQSSHFCYVIYAYDKKTERLEYSEVIVNSLPEMIKAVFNVIDKPYPFIFDSHPLQDNKHIDMLTPYLQRSIDLKRFDYFIEANAI